MIGSGVWLAEISHTIAFNRGYDIVRLNCVL